MVDTPKVDAHSDSDKEILKAVDILHENTEINTLAVEKEETRKADKDTEGKLDHRKRENENERLKNEVRFLEAKLKPENTEKVRKKSLGKTNALNDKYQNSVENQNMRSIHVVGDSMINMIQEN